MNPPATAFDLTGRVAVVTGAAGGLGLMADASSYGVARGAIKRAASADDMVGGMLYLVSSLAGFVTGQTLVIDGGRQFI